jgi:hypothetical protein
MQNTTTPRLGFRRTLQRAGLAGLAAVALAAAGCSASVTSAPNSSSGTPVKGGTATIALPADVTDNWIFPFYSIAYASVYNDQQFRRAAVRHRRGLPTQAVTPTRPRTA